MSAPGNLIALMESTPAAKAAYLRALAAGLKACSTPPYFTFSELR